MTIQFDPYQLFFVIVAIIGGLWTLGKVIWSSLSKNLEIKFKGITEAQNAAVEEAKKANENAMRIDRELMNLRADLPLNYVRRDDYIRGQSTLEAKLDALASKLEVIQIQGASK